VVIAGQVVASDVPRRPPELPCPCGAQGIGRKRMVSVVFKLKCDVMNPCLGQVNDVNDVVVAITGQEGRNASNIVGVPEA
jgi:hypothetical protein